MADCEEDAEDAISQTSRQRELTAKRLEEKLHRLIGQRRGKLLGQMTAKSNEVERLMDNDSLSDVNDVQKEMKVYNRLYEEFVELISSVMLYLKEEEKEADQDYWFQPKVDRCQQFMSKVKAWMQSIKQCDIEVTQRDSVSNVSKVSSASSARSSK